MSAATLPTSLIVIMGHDGEWQVREDRSDKLLFSSEEQDDALEFAVSQAVSNYSEVILYVPEWELAGCRLH